MSEPLADRNAAALAAAVGVGALARGWKLATAESCTGGSIAATLTDVPGSSEWFEAGIVTYRLSAKTRLLGVTAATLERYGAVSEPTARAMAEGALRASGADLVVAVTGTAGPGGGDVLVPVGTVWFAWAGASEHQTLQTRRCEFVGERASVRRQAVICALDGLLQLLR